jgi:knotted carbamoyltransferase YgeW
MAGMTNMAGIDQITKQLASVATYDTGDFFNNDFLLTWDHSDDQIKAILETAVILEAIRRAHLSCRAFDSGLAVSLFRDNSTRTRFSFSSAANLLGLSLQDLDEGKSQIAHGETVRETATMISFMAEVIGIRDDMYIGTGNTYMREVAAAVQRGHEAGVLEQRPTVVNLQCDIDHPTQAMADIQHLITEFGGIENLCGKKIAMSWAYSPSYGKPLSVPQGIVGLMTRFGMDVVLSHPEGYGIMPEVEKVARRNAETSSGSFTTTGSMREAFADADIVYPKSWAPFDAMKQRTELYARNEMDAIAALEKDLLAQNARHQDWQCDEALMKLTHNGTALYMHCLPADITAVSCEQGEVEASVFDRYRDSLYRQAGYKPYIIAAIIFLSRFADPQEKLLELVNRKAARR